MVTLQGKSDIENLLASQIWKSRKSSILANNFSLGIRRKSLNCKSTKSLSKKFSSVYLEPIRTCKTNQKLEKFLNYNHFSTQSSKDFENQVSPKIGADLIGTNLSYQYKIPVFPMVEFGKTKKNETIVPVFKLVSSTAQKDEVIKTAGRAKKEFGLRRERLLFFKDFTKLREREYLIQI